MDGLVHLDGIHLGRKAVVCDGGGGIAKALRLAWPTARMQRCLFHICPNVTALLSRNPRHEAGRELLRLAGDLSRVASGNDMGVWLSAYQSWENRHREFLDERSTWSDGTERDAHQRLVKARILLRRRIRERSMFTFMAPGSPSDTACRPPTTSSSRRTHASARCCATTAD